MESANAAHASIARNARPFAFRDVRFMGKDVTFTTKQPCVTN
jgi:hypothetical protein